MVDVQSIPSPDIHSEERAHEAYHPSSLLAAFGADPPLRLDCGIDLKPFQIAYQTYGQLNAERSNAILICHALTLDQHVANVHPLTGKPGWWEIMVGAGGWDGAPPAPPRPIRPPARCGGWIFRSSPFPTWCAHRPCCSTASASKRCYVSPAGRPADSRGGSGRGLTPTAASLS